MDTIKKIKELAILHGEAINNGNHASANQLNKKMSRLFQGIVTREQIDKFKELYLDQNESVRLCVASFILKIDSDFALKILNELKHSSTIIGLTAATMIDMWRKGLIK